MPRIPALSISEVASAAVFRAEFIAEECINSRGRCWQEGGNSAANFLRGCASRGSIVCEWAPPPTPRGPDLTHSTHVSPAAPPAHQGPLCHSHAPALQFLPDLQLARSPTPPPRPPRALPGAAEEVYGLRAPHLTTFFLCSTTACPPRLCS